MAIIDAYRVAEFMNAMRAAGDGRLGRARLPRQPLSIAGLLAVLLVMAGSHVAVARYDMLALDLLKSGCIFVGGQTTPVCDVDASATPAPGDSVASAEPEPSAVGAPVPNVSIPPWDGKERLNVLLIGTDQRPKRAPTTPTR